MQAAATTRASLPSTTLRARQSAPRAPAAVARKPTPSARSAASAASSRRAAGPSPARAVSAPSKAVTGASLAAITPEVAKDLYRDMFLGREFEVRVGEEWGARRGGGRGGGRGERGVRGDASQGAPSARQRPLGAARGGRGTRPDGRRAACLAARLRARIAQSVAWPGSFGAGAPARGAGAGGGAGRRSVGHPLASKT